MKRANTDKFHNYIYEMDMGDGDDFGLDYRALMNEYEGKSMDQADLDYDYLETELVDKIIKMNCPDVLFEDNNNLYSSPEFTWLGNIIATDYKYNRAVRLRINRDKQRLILPRYFEDLFTDLPITAKLKMVVNSSQCRFRVVQKEKRD